MIYKIVLLSGLLSSVFAQDATCTLSKKVYKDAHCCGASEPKAAEHKYVAGFDLGAYSMGQASGTCAVAYTFLNDAHTRARIDITLKSDMSPNCISQTNANPLDHPELLSNLMTVTPAFTMSRVDAVGTKLHHAGHWTTIFAGSPASAFGGPADQNVTGFIPPFVEFDTEEHTMSYLQTPIFTLTNNQYLFDAAAMLVQMFGDGKYHLMTH